MKKFMMFFLFVFVCFAGITPVLGAPLDLTGFTADPGATVNGGTVLFDEDETASAIYFFNDDFFVESNMTFLSFDYNFALGVDDVDDYLTFELNFSPELDVATDIAGGHFEIDLSSYQDQFISLAWGLIWDGDFAADTTAAVYNMDIQYESNPDENNPVPEPATFMLVALGAVCLFGTRKMRKV